MNCCDNIKKYDYQICFKCCKVEDQVTRFIISVNVNLKFSRTVFNIVVGL